MIVDDVTKLNLLETRKPDHALPRAFYTDPEIFDLDMRAICTRTGFSRSRPAKSRRPGIS